MKIRNPEFKGSQCTEQKSIKKWQPTLFSLFLLINAWLLNEVALSWIHDRVPTYSSPLPDLWFNFFPEVSEVVVITEYIMLFLLINALAVILCHKHNWIVAARVFFCVALAYFFRAFCITIIQLPVPSVRTYCAQQTNGGWQIILKRVMKISWSAGIEQLRRRELCGDLIVSGHTISIFTGILTLTEYSPRKSRLLTYFYNSLGAVAIICILLARKHYAIDIVLGYLTITRIFWTYHSLMKSYHNGDFVDNACSRSFWAPIVAYIENGAPTPQSFKNELLNPFRCSSRNIFSHRPDCSGKICRLTDKERKDFNKLGV